MSQEIAAPQNSGKTLMKLRRDRAIHIAAIFMAAGALTAGIPVISARQDTALQKLDQTKNNTAMILKFRNEDTLTFRLQCFHDRNSGARQIINNDQLELCISEKAIKGYAAEIVKQEDSIRQSANINAGALGLLSLSVAFIAALRIRRNNSKIHEIKQADFKL